MKERTTVSGKVSLMFSGGVDSTVAALELAKRYDEVHLVTFESGYGHYRIDRTARRADEIKKIAAARVVHEIIPSRPLFEAVVVNTLAQDLERYQSGFIWCMGCKLAMHALQIAYAREHGIAEAADGSSGETSEMVEQTLISISMLTYLYDDYGIAFRPSGYDVPRAEKIATLRSLGIRMGIPIRDRFLGVQPKCKAGELYYLPYLLFNQPPKHDEHVVASFIRDKTPTVRDYLARRGIEPVKRSA
jgi:hypothetical protein